MTDLAAPAPTRAAFDDLAHELSATRRLLERVPEEHLAWKPHERSMTLGGLASHLTGILSWQLTILQEAEFDLAAAPPPASGATSPDELLRRFDDGVAAVREAMRATPDAALAETWTLRRGDQVILSQPRAAVLRGMGISHLVHHRGQLTVYLRLLDVPLPPVYGPTADEGR